MTSRHKKRFASKHERNKLKAESGGEMRSLAAVAALVFTTMVFIFGGLFFSVLRSLGNWNRIYQRLGKRYAAKQSKGGVFYGYLLTNPSLSF